METKLSPFLYNKMGQITSNFSYTDNYVLWLEKQHKKDVVNAFKNGQYNSHPDTKSKIITGEEYYNKEF